MKHAMATLVASVAAVVLVSVAAGGHAATSQRVVVDGDSASFTLAVKTPGALASDSGPANFCCWITRSTVRDGQSVDITNGPTMTLKGRHGTLVARNRMEWLDTPGRYAIFTGTWKVIRGTGAYAGATGGGRVAGVGTPNGATKWRRSGVLRLP